MHTALLVAAVVIGGLLAVQASANMQLNKAIGTPFGAATLQLALAFGLLAVVAGATGSLSALTELSDVPFWQLLGGLASPLYITSGILLIPRFGALVTVGLFVAGQMLSSLLLDQLGLFGLERSPLTVGVGLGAIAVLAGIIVIVKSQGNATAGSEGSTFVRIGWLALGIIAGGVLPVQGAINSQLKEEIAKPFAVATISFGVATVTIAIVLFVLRALNKTPQPKLTGLPKMPWWGWVGGIGAAIYVTGTFLLMPQIGAAVTVALAVAGQQLTSAAIDHKGWFRLPTRPLTPHRIAGLGLLTAGALAIQLL